jgi:hypothetical protein
VPSLFLWLNLLCRTERVPTRLEPIVCRRIRRSARKLKLRPSSTRRLICACRPSEDHRHPADSEKSAMDRCQSGLAEWTGNCFLFSAQHGCVCRGAWQRAASVSAHRSDFLSGGAVKPTRSGMHHRCAPSATSCTLSRPFVPRVLSLPGPTFFPPLQAGRESAQPHYASGPLPLERLCISLTGLK